MEIGFEQRIYYQVSTYLELTSILKDMKVVDAAKLMVASAVPVFGSVLSGGGITFVAFKPGCIRLRNTLMQYHLSDPAYYIVNSKDNRIN